jgi:hypothetical protein
MPGGIVEMAAYGNQELYLTSQPQITFFKIVFRRHTNFAVETVRQHFANPVDFGSDATVIVNKIGDLMGKVYLEFTLPEVAISAPETLAENRKTSKVSIQKLFELVQIYTQLNANIARKISSLITISNVTLDSISSYVKSPEVNDPLDSAADAIYDVTNSPDVYSVSIVNLYNGLFTGNIFQMYTQADPDTTITRLSGEDKTINQYFRNKVKQLIFEDFYPRLKSFYDNFYEDYVLVQNFNKKNRTTEKTFEKTAWAEEPGHAIIEEVQFSIGNKRIDTQNGQWLSIHNQLQTFGHTEAYNILIGQVPELVDFNHRPKPAYALTIPLQFYFCKYSGLAVPLISLRHSDISFDFRFRSIEQLLRTEYDLDLDLKPQNASLFVEYYFLANDERERFATRVQEYLIETVSWRTFDNLVTSGNSVTISFDFNHPTKYITWFGQPQFFRLEPNLAYFKYDYRNQSVITYTRMYLNNIVRLDTHVRSSFYNYVQPYYYAKRTPSKGLQMYSFALYPFDYNPSGTVNLSRIDTIRMELEFNPEAVEVSMLENNGMYTGVYAVAYNVLRIANGVGSLAFE